LSGEDKVYIPFGLAAFALEVIVQFAMREFSSHFGAADTATWVQKLQTGSALPPLVCFIAGFFWLRRADLLSSFSLLAMTFACGVGSLIGSFVGQLTFAYFGEWG
jgi:hypothetical protein